MDFRPFVSQQTGGWWEGKRAFHDVNLLCGADFSRDMFIEVIWI